MPFFEYQYSDFSSKLVDILLQSLHKSAHVVSVALEILATNDQISEKFLLKYVFQINVATIRAITAAKILAYHGVRLSLSARNTAGMSVFSFFALSFSLFIHSHKIWRSLPMQILPFLCRICRYYGRWQIMNFSPAG